MCAILKCRTFEYDIADGLYYHAYLIGNILFAGRSEFSLVASHCFANMLSDLYNSHGAPNLLLSIRSESINAFSRSIELTVTSWIDTRIHIVDGFTRRYR